MPVTSDRPDVTIPDVGIHEYLYGDLSPEDEDRIAVVDLAGGTETSYATLRSHVDSVAGWLSRHGVAKNDVVALHCPNSVEFIVAAHAVWRLGAVLTPVPLLASPPKVAEQLRDSHAVMLLTLAGLGDGGEEAAELAGLPGERLIHLDTSRGLNQMLAERSTPPSVSFDPSTQLAALPYSSGTTGLPKGVRLTHRNLVANMAQVEVSGPVTREDVVFGVLPFFHIYGLTTLANLTLRLRARLLTVPRFELNTFLRNHQKHGVTFTFIAPPVALALAKHPEVDNYDLSALRGVLSGAASLDGELATAVHDRLGIEVYQGYGLTESSPVTHVNLGDGLSPGSVGRPVANTEHKLVDPDTGEEIAVPSGTDGTSGELSAAGELWVRGPQIMDGYLGNPEATADALPGDGWLRTGDLAHQGASGEVFIVDRVKELIKYKGYQVPPAELEALLLTHEAVADAAVVGVTDADGEEIPKAFVVAQDPAAAGDELADTLVSFVAERVEPYKKLRALQFIAEVPKSATGKILRRSLA
ncbi:MULTISPECIES: AMP-binding protein [unclassified Corynebacterium]|uniref:AMP-binding protein n=1 Tax=unclassified Corynebacterium TaxID=2624378 RepID=UPI0026523415|nr:AMP-binding protein [Corynebacterium sp.]MDN6326125.1 AMP-binding protein [Corynebacterium sp.]MDN6510446.1 AMP-binding protein [Corynebacterium sp.]